MYCVKIKGCSHDVILGEFETEKEAQRVSSGYKKALEKIRPKIDRLILIRIKIDQATMFFKKMEQHDAERANATVIQREAIKIYGHLNQYEKDLTVWVGPNHLRRGYLAVE